MFIDYAIETLRDNAPLPRQKAVGIFDIPHLLLRLRQSSLRGTANLIPSLRTVNKWMTS